MKTKNHFMKPVFLTSLLLALCGQAINLNAGEAELKRIELFIFERKVQLDNKTIRLTEGDSVELVWNSDEAGELHLHGYDISFKVSPDAPAIVAFEARATGRFPVTSHGFGGEVGHGHDALLYIEVYPD
jgi:hypothetical protein